MQNPADPIDRIVKQVADYAHTFGADVSKGFILGGTSAGGNIAASLAHRAQQDPYFEARRLTGSILTVPTLVHPHGYPEEFVMPRCVGISSTNGGDSVQISA